MRSTRTTMLSLAIMATLAGSTACATSSATRAPGTVVDDAAITTTVKAKLIGDKETKARQIDVDTRSGLVQLNGFVESAAAKAEAERIARTVDGVTKVHNNLDVRTGTRSVGEVMNDTEITAKIEAQLAADKRTSALAIDVGTRDGVVQLGGFAKSADEKRTAEELAMTVKGVQTVKNNIDIR